MRIAYQPSPKQALFLWNLLCASPPEGVMQSRTRPSLSLPERRQLLDAGYVNLEKRGAASYLTLGEQAWTWAERASALTLPSSPLAAEVLEALLRRLVPFLESRRIGLAEVLPAVSSGSRGSTEKPRSAPTRRASEKLRPHSRSAQKLGTDKVSHSEVRARSAPTTLGERIEKECLSLAAGKRQTRIMLSALRRRLEDVARGELDRWLLTLQEAQRLVLYREDNTAALTDEERSAALVVNNEPRHLVMLEGQR